MIYHFSLIIFCAHKFLLLSQISSRSTRREENSFSAIRTCSPRIPFGLSKLSRELVSRYIQGPRLNWCPHLSHFVPGCFLSIAGGNEIAEMFYEYGGFGSALPSIGDTQHPSVPRIGAQLGDARFPAESTTPGIEKKD